MSEFEKYARNHCGISSLKLHDFQSVSAAYVSPTIIEERQLNIATMDVFSRLMMDRIIFLGAPIYDDAANIIQAQLLFLESVDPEMCIRDRSTSTRPAGRFRPDWAFTTPCSW